MTCCRGATAWLMNCCVRAASSAMARSPAVCFPECPVRRQHDVVSIVFPCIGALGSRRLRGLILIGLVGAALIIHPTMVDHDRPGGHGWARRADEDHRNGVRGLQPGARRAPDRCPRARWVDAGNAKPVERHTRAICELSRRASRIRERPRESAPPVTFASARLHRMSRFGRECVGAGACQSRCCGVAE
jgi:hypothetical protein